MKDRDYYIRLFFMYLALGFAGVALVILFSGILFLFR